MESLFSVNQTGFRGVDEEQRVGAARGGDEDGGGGGGVASQGGAAGASYTLFHTPICPSYTLIRHFNPSTQRHVP